MRKHAFFLALTSIVVVCAILVFGFDLHAVNAAGAAEFIGAMTTLAANKPRVYEGGHRIEENVMPVIASDIIYEGAAVGFNDAAGTVGPLGTSSCNKFCGFAYTKADNSAGAASAINCDLITQGHIVLPVTGAVITDVKQPVYATDDDTFAFSPVSGYFVGYIHRWISAGVALVAFNADWQDPLCRASRMFSNRRTTPSSRPTTANGFGSIPTRSCSRCRRSTASCSASATWRLMASRASRSAPAAADLITGPGITAADNKDLINTKATAQRGDWPRFRSATLTAGWCRDCAAPGRARPNSDGLLVYGRRAALRRSFAFRFMMRRAWRGRFSLNDKDELTNERSLTAL
jgi:hypothetical protein